ncbi:MAG: hypothetical protein A3J55_03590 [Candidatus Ryanbacteria bacterium RIFCSPHIGHO2_02_FULL_45_17b]|uniref:Uncharacterized protein n=1 Tax=Candidatus Ryanbacteria bacterium RIFCSPHIGHO2_01_FULL_45_22 TaxID=1802114 RepID=A0A1G2G329_9BACT|nr:MAG: hypothetical protein A2719_04785 [Candidatus Ryanbacteria bacterium RIFCSPHIGHO2_01_FULL_45_22]OGZ47541.1 MAG: hypothetical protein A3J55_03590 [Candidatus Ryanbacteria bacterium RIFCSPHIGHO2_02_FULL_45_17b]
MNTIRPYVWIGAGVSCAVWLLWLLLGGVFSAASSIAPYAQVIVVVAVVVGVVAWVLRYPATTINTLGDNNIVWGLFQIILVIGFIVLFIQAVLWVNSNEFLLWAGIDASPRVRAFMSVVVVALCLFPLPPFIEWIIDTEGIFAKAVWRTLFATSFLLLVASIFLPKTLFDSVTGAPLAKIDSEGNTFYNPTKKFSPATGEPLEPITTEQAKKIKPWWEGIFGVVQKWNGDRRSIAQQARELAAETAASSTPKPECTQIQHEDSVLSGTRAITTMITASACREFYFEQHDFRGVVKIEKNPCGGGMMPFFQKVSGSPQISGYLGGPAWINLDRAGTRVDWKGFIEVKKSIPSLWAVTKLSCVP